MSAWLQKLWLHWLNQGVQHTTDMQRTKQIRLLNAIRAPAIVFILVMFRISIINGAPLSTVINSIILFMLVSLSALLTRGHFEAARRRFFFATVSVVIAYHFIYGMTVVSYNSLFPIIGTMTLVYRHKDFGARILPMVSLTLVLCTMKWGSHLATPIQSPSGANILTNFALNLTLTFLCFRFLQNENAMAEAKLSEDTDLLAQSKLELEQRNTALEVQAKHLAEARSRAEEANAFKSKFLAKISHEVRTPMNGVLGMAQLLQNNNDLTPEQQEYVDIIAASGQQQLKIINDLLDFAKIESGKTTLDLHSFSFRETLQSTAKTFAIQCADRHINFKFEMADEVPVEVLSDAIKIKQILLNLLGNALKFTKEGQVSLSAFMNGTRTIMEVSDTGIGMTPDQLNRIFNPFQQADDSITRHFGGTGLGLAIVHELVLLMGGEITVESTFNKGTTFRVALNLPIVAKTALADNNSKSEPMLELPTGLKILVAEDNPTNVIVVKRFLDKIKAEVTVAADGAFALEAFTQNTFDLILMDLHMPRVSGMDAVLAIRERETKENRPKTPIVALTADVQSEVISKCFEIGFNGFLEKPLKKEALYRAIHESLVIGQKMSKTA